MGPVKTVVPVSFAGGLDTKTDPKQVLPGKLLTAQNVIFGQAGAIARRWGYKALGQSVIGSSSNITACKALNAFNDELLLYDGTLAYSYLQAPNAWASRGGVVSVIQSNRQIVRNTHQQLSPDQGTLLGITVTAWEDSRGGLRYSVSDAATGTLIVSDKPLYIGAASTDIRPKVIPYAAAGVILVFFATAAGTICFVTINPAAPAAAVVSNTVLNGIATPGFFDVCVSGSSFFCAFYTPGAVTLCALNSSLNVPWTAVVASQASVPVGALNVCADGSGNAWVTYANGGAGSTACSTAVYSSSGSVVLAPVQTIAPGGGALDAVAAIVSGTKATIFAEVHASTSYNQLLYSNTLTLTGTLGAAAGSAPVFKRSVGLASKPFSYAGGLYVNVAFQSQQQATYFTLDSGGNVVAKVNAGLGGGLVVGSDSMLPECTQFSTGIFGYANLVRGQVNTEAGVVLALLGVNVTTLDFLDTNHFLSDAINGEFYTVGGVLQRYDGSAYVEHGFHVYPEGIATATSSSGGSLGTGTYDYAVTYEWTDNTGAVEISTPSLIASVTFGGGTTNKVTLTIPTLRLTKKSGVQVVVYRTAANGTLLYRVTSAIAPLYNDPTVDTVQLVDTLADTSITANGAMYTQPLTVGSNPVLSNAAPPACTFIATFDDRLFLGGLDDGYSLWFSKQSIPNTPIEFAAEQTLRTDPDGGPMTALARMDDKLVIFKSSAIFFLSGQGPTATGDQNGFSAPVGIPSGGVGCINANSVVLTPIGLMFQSTNGIYLLDRSLNVSYKGAPVEAFNALTIGSADLIPNQWAVFTSPSGTALVYDYYYDQWSTFSNHAAVDADMYLGAGNVYVWAAANGQVFEQTPSSFSDAGTPIPISLTTAWLNPGTIQGYQRIYHAFVLGTYEGTGVTLNVWCGFDYADAFTALATIPVDSALGLSTFGSDTTFGSGTPFGGGGGGAGDSVFQFRIDVLRKCEAIRFQISDQQSAPGNEGFRLSALSLVLGVKQGGHKLPAFKQFGAS